MAMPGSPRPRSMAGPSLVRDYLRGRQSLKKLCLLVDSRHGLKESDEELMDMMDEAGVAYQIILTKVDKVKTQQRDKTLAIMCRTAIKKRAAAFPEVMVTSSAKGWGIPELRALLNGVALNPSPCTGDERLSTLDSGNWPGTR